MEEKNVFKMSAVAFINVPVYDEISAKNIVEMAKGDKIASSYLPDEYFENKTPDRAYLMNIINTLYPDYME